MLIRGISGLQTTGVATGLATGLLAVLAVLLGLLFQLQRQLPVGLSQRLQDMVPSLERPYILPMGVIGSTFAKKGGSFFVLFYVAVMATYQSSTFSSPIRS